MQSDQNWVIQKREKNVANANDNQKDFIKFANERLSKGAVLSKAGSIVYPYLAVTEADRLAYQGIKFRDQALDQQVLLEQEQKKKAAEEFDADDQAERNKVFKQAAADKNPVVDEVEQHVLAQAQEHHRAQAELDL